MGFHNPFLKDGLIKFPDNGSVVKHVEKWAKVRGDRVAYRFLDYSVERDGICYQNALRRNAHPMIFLIAKLGTSLTLVVRHRNSQSCSTQNWCTASITP